MGRKKKVKESSADAEVCSEVKENHIKQNNTDIVVCSRCSKQFDKRELGWLWITGYVCQTCVSEKRY